MLILDIYGYADAVLTTELKAEKARLWDDWEIAWEQDLSSGMFCRMYHPKLSGALTPFDVCPPVLVFRGSEMNEADIDELAVHVELTCNISATGLPVLLMDVSSFSPPLPVISLSKRFAPTSTRAELSAAGLREQALILPSSGREVIAASLGGLIGLGNINIDWTGSASLFYGPNGDWPTNISRALGNVPAQYEEAIAVAKEAADEAMGVA